jgi:Outer membrane protein beta-barrel domain
MKVFVCLLGCFLSALPACAQNFNRIDIYTGYSYVRAHPANETDEPTVKFVPSPLPNFNLHGGEGSLTYNFNKYVGGVLDFAGYQSSKLSALYPWQHGNMYTYLAGPRFSYRSSSRFTPYAQVLFGPAVTRSRLYFEQNQTEFAMTIGEGMDFRVNRRLSLRPFEADYLLTHFKEDDDFFTRRVQNNLRLGVGLVFHFF